MVVPLERLYLLDVGDIVPHSCEGGQGLRRYSVPQILLYLHCDLNGIERVESVVGEGASTGHACLRREVPLL